MTTGKKTTEPPLHSTSLTHLPKRSFGTVAVAYADHTTEDKEERAFSGEDTAMTPDEVLQAKNQEENRRKSEYKHARLGAEVRLFAEAMTSKDG